MKFISRGHGYSLRLSENGAELRLAGGGGRPATLRARFSGASARQGLRGEEELPGKSNYFVGSDPTQWHTGIRNYRKVRYAGVYPGIDVVYYGRQDEIEYDLVVAPGTDPKTIRLAISGANTLKVNEQGDLVMAYGAREFKFRKPEAYQRQGAGRREIGAAYVVRGKHEIGFKLEEFDRTRELVIDPVLVYATYVGGSGGDIAGAIAVDTDGNVYITGKTDSLDFPTKNAYQSSSSGQVGVAFVTKLDPTGSSLIYSTYLGGAVSAGDAIAVDANENAYIAGIAQGSFPTTTGAYQSSPPAVQNAFLAELGPTGGMLVYSTYLGGSTGATSPGRTLALDNQGLVYLTGSTTARDFPVTTGAFQSTPKVGLGAQTGFVAKIDTKKSGGDSLLYSTYLGGSSEDLPAAITARSTGVVYVAGATKSSDFPVQNAFQSSTTHFQSAFVSALDTTQTGAASLLYSTYLGGSDANAQELATAIATDSNGNVVVAGWTDSTDFPTTAGVFQTTLQGVQDGFITCINPSLSGAASLLYSTYLGAAVLHTFDAPAKTRISALAVNGSGEVHVTGNTNSLAFPILNAVVSLWSPAACTLAGSTYSPCGSATFVTKLNSTATSLVYSTYLSAYASFDSGDAIAVDSSGKVYVTGPMHFAVTQGAYQTAMHGAYVAKISPDNLSGFSVTAYSQDSRGVQTPLPDPFNIVFPDQAVGSTSGHFYIDAPGLDLYLTVYNTGSETRFIQPAFTGDFGPPPVYPIVEPPGTGGITDTTFYPFVPGGWSATFGIAFTPTAEGLRTGTMTFTDIFGSTPQVIQLSGKGVLLPVVTLSGGPYVTLYFPPTPVGGTSTPMSVSLTNTGHGDLAISSIALTANSFGGFKQTTNCAATVPAGASCSLSYTYTPAQVSRYGDAACVSITDNAQDSPQQFCMSGGGIPAPPVLLSPLGVIFDPQVVGGTSAGQKVSLIYSAGTPLTITSVTTSGDFKVLSNGCGNSVAPASECNLTVGFTPSATGSRTGSLAVADNSAGSPQSITLTGSGTDFSLAGAGSSSTSQTLTAGQTATYTLNVSGASGFSGMVAFACMGAPTGATCSVSPNQVMYSGTAATPVTVSVDTTARTIVGWQRRSGRVLAWTLCWVALGAVLLPRSSLRKRRLMAASGLILVLAMSGCGGGGGSTPQQPLNQTGTPAGIYTLTVSATANGVAHNTTLTLTVQ